MATEIWQVKISQLNTISDWRDSYTIVTDRNGQSVKAPLEQVSKIGDLSELDTTDKSSLVAAINEAATTGAVTVDSALSSTSENPVQNKVINTALAGKQATLVSGTNIKTINSQNILGSGNLTIQGTQGERGLSVFTVNEDASGFIPGQDNEGVIVDGQFYEGDLFIGQYGNVYEVTNPGMQEVDLLYRFSIRGPQGPTGQGTPGVGFDDVSTQQDGTIVITLTNGDTITIDLNHQHPQYPKYVYCSTQAAYDAIVTKASDTLYLILESQS